MSIHRFEFGPSAVQKTMLPTVLGALLLGAGFHAWAALRPLPAAMQGPGIDGWILRHRVAASRRPAGIVLVGDSSCLTGVSGKRLGQRTGSTGGVLNLGAVSFLDLAAFATLASNCIAASPGPPVVVLLVHPEFLRRPAAEPRYLGWFSAMNSGDPIPAEDLAGRLRGFSGVEIFRDRIEPAFRPEPLPGAYGLRHGFGTRLVAALDADAGGLTDPHRYLPERRPAAAPFDLSPRLGPLAAAFGRALAGKTSALLVGITPVPESLAGPDQAARHARVAETLAAWIGGGTRPLGLPATYPDARFASATHLDGPGRIDFTDRLSEALAKAGVVR